MKCFVLNILFLSVWRSTYGAILATNHDCSYNVDTNKNIISVACRKNVTVSVRKEPGGFDISGDRMNTIWFLNDNDNGANIFQRRHRPSKTSHADGDGPNNNASKKLKDATSILKRMKKRLGIRSRKLRNITLTLEDADRALERDIANLTQWSSGSYLQRQATIATLTNQYRFLSTAMLSQNAEMKTLISYMGNMISATQKSVRSSMSINDQLQQEVMLLNMALVKANITRVEKASDFCPRTLSSIGTDGDSIKVGIAQGTFMRDPIPAGHYFVTFGYNDIYVLVEYKTLEFFEMDNFVHKYELPFTCEGTGHVVYKNTLYCHKAMSKKIVKYDLILKKWEGELELSTAGTHNTYPYESGTFTDIDFAVDEFGLWVIYATPTSHGNIIISKMNDREFEIEETWMTNIPKQNVGNTFMICGIMYAVDSYRSVPTYIKYMFNTNTGSTKILGPGEIPFKNTLKGDFAQNYMLDYNPMDRKLYAWNHHYVEMYPTY